MTAGEIQEALGLSKGAVSMVTREIEQWGVVHRVRVMGDSSWRFIAETDLLRMIRRVIEERESRLIVRIASDLEEAERRARAAGRAPKDVLDRIRRMRALADATRVAVETFLKTSRLDVKGLADILKGSVRGAWEKVRP